MTNLNKTKTEEIGLVKGQDDSIYVYHDSFEGTWTVFRTKINGNSAEQLFIFETQTQAITAAKKIAVAIGGAYYRSDPRK